MNLLFRILQTHIKAAAGTY
ncbi:hypothetical protein VCHC59A1_1253A, partial [Vibrio cholerae HC-59A1]